MDLKPKYIKENCEKCSSKLELWDLIHNPNIKEEDIWYDEWTCPKCKDGIHMDWPPEKVQELRDLANKYDLEKWDELTESEEILPIYYDELFKE